MIVVIHQSLVGFNLANAKVAFEVASVQYGILLGELRLVHLNLHYVAEGACHAFMETVISL